MKSFIDLCVSDILQKNSQNLVNTTVVFPSKRAMVFFKKSLSEQISQPIFLPKMTSIQDLCVSKQESTIPDDFTLVYLLYRSYLKFSKSAETFEDFYPWGEMLLSDFDDIDKYKINAKDLFTNIADIKDIDSAFSYLNKEQIDMISRFWDTTKISGETDENDVRKNFIKFWNLLPGIYTDFKSQLKEQNLCYEGVAMRNVAESDVNELNQYFGDGKFIFLGFNALSQCETAIFKFLQNKKQASFYWDYDTYYKEDDSHEAGIFIRKNIQQFPNELSKDCFSNFENEKNIHIIQTPNEISQAKLCCDLLKQQQSLNNTAIILADEKLIVPIMKSIPNEIRYNITLGYPIRLSAAYTFFESILDLCANKKGTDFYYKDILRICENSLIPIELQRNAKLLHSYVNKEKKITLSAEECAQKSGLEAVFKIDTTLNSYIQNLTNCILEICKTFHLDEIDKSIFYTIFTELSALKTIVEKNEISFDKISFVNNLLKRSLQGKTIAIEGQPLEGLQVMGILETRMLDFENIIMTSVMDGNLPKTSVGGSFIPYNLRIAFGMPTIKEQSAMYSYYFYRLIQRCKNLTLLYCENSGENKCEKSRFVLQLLYESPFKNLTENTNNPNKKLAGIQTETYGYDITPNDIQTEQIPKSRPEFLDYIESLKTKRFLAPSALTQFIECQKKFYFSQVKKLKKPQEIDELPKPFDIGTYFHDTMELIYTPLVGKTIDEKVIDDILKDEDAIKMHISNVLKKNHCPANIANPESKEFQSTLMQIKKFLNVEKQLPFKLIALESDKNQIQMDNGINIGGRIDRLDFCQDTYRIIDYKTGKCTLENLPKKLTVSNIDDFFQSETLQKEAFQVCMYAYILKSINKDKNYQPNLIFLQTINEKNNQSKLTINNEEVLTFDGELFDQFADKFEELINNLISTEGYFAETTNGKKCDYCDFKDFCRK